MNKTLTPKRVASDEEVEQAIGYYDSLDGIPFDEDPGLSFMDFPDFPDADYEDDTSYEEMCNEEIEQIREEADHHGGFEPEGY